MSIKQQKHKPSNNINKMSDNTQNQNPTLEQALGELKPARLPKDIYICRIKDCKFGNSKAGNPMFTMEIELIDNPPIAINGKPEDINGQSTFKYFSLNDKAFAQLGKLHKSAGLPLTLTLNEVLNNPNPDFYKGVKFKALWFSEPNPQTREDGTPIIDP